MMGVVKINNLVELYHNAKTQEERNEALCKITEQYTIGKITKEELDDEIIERCPAIYYDDYFYEEELCEMLGVSKEEYLKTLDEETEHDIDVDVGDIVAFDANARYKDSTMWNLVRTNHCFLVTEKFDDMIKVYAMTTRLDMMNKRPGDYVEIQSGTKRALVELNAYGVNKQSKVRKVIARADADDLNKVIERLKTYTERTTVCENLIDMVRKYSGRMAYEE